MGDELEIIDRDEANIVEKNTDTLLTGEGVSLHGKNPSFIKHAENIYFNVKPEKDEDGSGDSKAKNRKKYLIIAVSVAVIVLLSIIIGVNLYRENDKDQQYTSLMDDANTKMKNGKYLEAAEIFHQASHMTDNKEDFVAAASLEADCYYMFASTEDDNDILGTSYSYYDRAIEIYNGILSNEKYEGTEYYYDAAAGLSNCYYVSLYPSSNVNWKRAVEIMEDRYWSIHDNKDSSLFYQLMKLDASLALYYNRAARESLERTFDQELSEKALKYFNEYAELSHASRSSKGIRNYNEDVFLIAQISDNLFVCGLATKTPNKYTDEVIKICEMTISDIGQSGYTLDPMEYARIKYILGKAYYFKSTFSTEAEQKQYLEQSYEYLSPLITEALDPYDDLHQNIGYYCSMTGLCSEKDIKQILSIIRVHQKAISSAPQKAIISAQINALHICAFITICYDNSDDAMSLGKDISENLMAKKEYLDAYTLKTVEEFHDYFHDNGSVPDYIQSMLDRVSK